MKKVVLIIIGLLAIQICISQINYKIDWKSDIDSLAKQLPEKHFNFFTVKTKQEYLSKLNEIKINTERLTDFEIAIKLQQVISSFGDSHTRIGFEKFIEKEQILPLQLFWFSDGLFILHTTQKNKIILGCKILSVSGFPLKRVADSLSRLITNENIAIPRIAIPQFFPWLQVLSHFGFVREGKVDLELEDFSGKKIIHTIEPAIMDKVNRATFKPDSVALCYQNERAFFAENYNTIDKIYYLQYNKCWSKELAIKSGDEKNAEKLPSFKEFENRVFKTLETNSVNKIIIDLRFNGGGNSSQGTEFAKKLSIYLQKNSTVKAYVIIGRNTFSSAIINALDFKRLMNAVFVGEETAGKPDHFGEVKSWVLQNSGVNVYYSTKYFKHTNSKQTTIKPDVKLETSFIDFKKGVDPPYEWIKRQKN